MIVDGLNTVSKERYLLAHDLRLKSLHHLVETGLNLKFKLRKSKINIIHVIRNAFFIPLKINFLYTIEKPIHPRMGFFNDLSRSTLIY